MKSEGLLPGVGDNKRGLPKNSSDAKQTGDNLRSNVQRQLSAQTDVVVRAKSGPNTPPT